MEKIKRVTICGGTHGNELTGIHLVKGWLGAGAKHVARSSFSTTCLVANPEAVAANRRYIDVDLNRCFATKDLMDDGNIHKYEHQRAKYLNSMMGPTRDYENSPDVLVDLHSTNSNMGVTFILHEDDIFGLRLARHLQVQNIGSKYPLRVYTYSQDKKNTAFLGTLAKISAFGIEVGPVSHSTLSSSLYFFTQKIVYDLLDYIEEYNINESVCTGMITVFRSWKNVDYPRDEDGELKAMVHPDLEGKDFTKISKGTPLLIAFDLSDICYDEKLATQNIAHVSDNSHLEIPDVYPVFINEAAYYEKNFAMTLTLKQEKKV